MARINDIEENYVRDMDSDNVPLEIASEHYIKAYKRGLAEGRRKSLVVVQEAKKELNKNASTMPGPVWHNTMQWIAVIESKL